MKRFHFFLYPVSEPISDPRPNPHHLRPITLVPEPPFLFRAPLTPSLTTLFVPCHASSLFPSYPTTNYNARSGAIWCITTSRHAGHKPPRARHGNATSTPRTCHGPATGLTSLTSDVIGYRRLYYVIARPLYKAAKPRICTPEVNDPPSGGASGRSVAA